MQIMVCGWIYRQILCAPSNGALNLILVHIIWRTGNRNYGFGITFTFIFISCKA